MNFDLGLRYNAVDESRQETLEAYYGSDGRGD